VFDAADARWASHGARVTIGFPELPASWRYAPAHFRNGSLTILGHPVMEDWEAPYMHRLAGIAAGNGGVVLEVGFGLGLSAGYLQRHEIERHIVLEANGDVFARLLDFARRAPRPVDARLGFWQDLLPTIPDGSIDGILFDTYPMNESELHCNHFTFFAEAHRVLRPGGIFTYYSDEITDFSPRHLSLLRAAGFTSIEREVCAVDPPAGCLYWRSETIMVPVIVK
jgi:guanidinoacetate N-methyltransferase